MMSITSLAMSSSGTSPTQSLAVKDKVAPLSVVNTDAGTAVHFGFTIVQTQTKDGTGAVMENFSAGTGERMNPAAIRTVNISPHAGLTAGETMALGTTQTLITRSDHEGKAANSSAVTDNDVGAIGAANTMAIRNQNELSSGFTNGV